MLTIPNWMRPASRSATPGGDVYSRKIGMSEPLQLHLTREQIADHLGLRLQTVSRAFTLLKNAGLIALVGSDAVSIVDCKRLSAFARLTAA